MFNAWWTGRNGNPTQGTFYGLTADEIFEVIESQDHYPGTEITIQEVIRDEN
jgi:hypothetical protein